MAIPPELKFDDEDDFVLRFLVPLLQRQGFVVVANYHRTGGELGKDLVFGDIDRFGHIRYSALQAKYVRSIGVNAVSTLVEDAKQAFGSPFVHPQTGAKERIQTFYAANGGSISADARTHFFDAIGHPLSACCRLLDGKALLTLDRWSAMSQSSTILPDLNGLMLEIEYNRRVAKLLLPTLLGLAERLKTLKPANVLGDPISPQYCFRVNASAHYVQRPYFVENLPSKDVEGFHGTYNLCNAMLQRCSGLITVEVVSNCVSGLQQYLPCAIVLGDRVAKKVAEIIKTLGPLAAIKPS